MVSAVEIADFLRREFPSRARSERSTNNVACYSLLVRIRPCEPETIGVILRTEIDDQAH